MINDKEMQIIEKHPITLDDLQPVSKENLVVDHYYYYTVDTEFDTMCAAFVSFSS